MKTTVTYAGDMKFVATNLHHTNVIDFPKSMGGNEEGPNPFQLLVSALGSCLGGAIVQYCNTIGLSAECLRIDLDWNTTDDPPMLDSVMINLQLPSETWQKRGDAIKGLIKHCPIFKTLQNPPHVEVDVGLQAEPE